MSGAGGPVADVLRAAAAGLRIDGHLVCSPTVTAREVVDARIELLEEHDPPLGVTHSHKGRGSYIRRDALVKRRPVGYELALTDGTAWHHTVAAGVDGAVGAVVMWCGVGVAPTSVHVAAV